MAIKDANWVRRADDPSDSQFQESLKNTSPIRLDARTTSSRRAARSALRLYWMVISND